MLLLYPLYSTVRMFRVHVLLAVYPIARYGYTRDYDVEQLYRDNRLNMIHEGTAGVQSLDLLGRKMVAKQV